jgi:hypothetical protein
MKIHLVSSTTKANRKDSFFYIFLIIDIIKDKCAQKIHMGFRKASFLKFNFHGLANLLFFHYILPWFNWSNLMKYPINA